MTDVNEAEGWAKGLDELAGRLAPRFGRVEPRRRLLAYLRGLLAPSGRKNGWRLAEAAGDRTPDGMQDFLSRMGGFWSEAQRVKQSGSGRPCQAPRAAPGAG